MYCLQIMIAEKGSRGKGIATEALSLFMAFAVRYLVGSLRHPQKTCAFCGICMLLRGLLRTEPQ